VYDVNGDGLNDVVTALSAHQYGIAWFEQKRAVGGNITFVQHPIMGDLSTKSLGNVVFSEPHASDHLRSRRRWSSGFPRGQAPLLAYESYLDPIPMARRCSTGTGQFAIQGCWRSRVCSGADPQPLGVGSHFAAVDLNKDGAPDIITSGNRGTFIFFNRLRASAAKPAAKK